MSDFPLVLMQTRYQLTSIVRNRRAVLFSLVLPVVLLVMFNSVFAPGSGTVALGGARVGGHAYFTGGMLTYAVLLSAFSQLAIGLVNQRETGQLKRLRGTPVPAWTFVVATVLRAIVVVAFMTVVLILVARFAYDVRFSAAGLAEVVLFAVLGTAAFASLALAATALVTDVDSAGRVYDDNDLQTLLQCVQAGLQDTVVLREAADPQASNAFRAQERRQVCIAEGRIALQIWSVRLADNLHIHR